MDGPADDPAAPVATEKDSTDNNFANNAFASSSNNNFSNNFDFGGNSNAGFSQFDGAVDWTDPTANQDSTW